MYNIAICDDEQDFADEMKQYIQRYQEESGEELRVMVFRNGLELIENYDPSTDLIFLDIQMDQMDGLETAKRIREKDEEAGISFLTSLKQYALEGYQYQAVNYLIKPMKYIRLKTELDRWIKKCRKKNPCIVIANDQGTFKAAVNEIHYIETYKRNLLLHMDEGEVISYESMKALEQRLSPFGFYRCHAGYLVNMGLVRKVEKLEITLSSDETVYVSKPKKKDFMKALAGYWGKML